MEETREKLLAYAKGLKEELRARADTIRQESHQFNEYRDGRYAARFEGVAAKIEGAAAKVEGILARLEADRFNEETKGDLGDEIRRQVFTSLGIEKPDEGATEEEKLRILQMLETGTISTEQAEELLRAL